MPQLKLFGDEEELAPQAARLAPKLKDLAGEGVYFGTSSWKYEGWLGSIYSASRYTSRGRLSTRRFENECLHEYSMVFPLVGGDFSFYQFPTIDYWSRLFKQAANHLLFALKVPEDITAAIWPRHERFGKKAGTQNAHFLDARLLEQAFLRPLEPYHSRLAPLILEFGTIGRKVFGSVKEFAARLEPFLAGLPKQFRYAVEIRNPEYFVPAYFEVLGQNHVAHVFNSWTRMPSLAEQVQARTAFTTDFTVARALLQPGVSYEAGVANFQPYKNVQKELPDVRDALKTLATRARTRKQPAFLLVNNRLEGNAPGTIEGVLDSL
jgi:uncharacterized protein YecE (DUF72 family)